MQEFWKDVRSHALPVSEIPGFLFWKAKKSLVEIVSTIVIVIAVIVIVSVITGWFPV